MRDELRRRKAFGFGLNCGLEAIGALRAVYGVNRGT